MNIFARVRYRFAKAEACQRCGSEIKQIWYCGNALWFAVIGKPKGTICIKCFDELAEKQNLLLTWHASIWQRRELEK